MPPRSVALPMSEWLVVGGLALALIWSRFAWVLPFDIPNQVEHLPGMIVTAGLALTFFGGALRPRRASVSL
ncbi:MAG: hypothetical protein OEW22_10655, partial [Rubrivivax sp.]|nr:hypothetical protein [Rubrivivax sp.]